MLLAADRFYACTAVFWREGTLLQHRDRVDRLVQILEWAVNWCVDTGDRDACVPHPAGTMISARTDSERWSFRKLSRSSLL